MREVQHRITNKNHQLLVLAGEGAAQRLIPGLDDNAFTDPLPKLSLGGPELLPVATDDARSLALSLFLLVAIFPGAHSLVNTRVPLHGNSFRCGGKSSVGKKPHTVPRREALFARQHQVFKA